MEIYVDKLIAILNTCNINASTDRKISNQLYLRKFCFVILVDRAATFPILFFSFFLGTHIREYDQEYWMIKAATRRDEVYKPTGSYSSLQQSGRCNHLLMSLLNFNTVHCFILSGENHHSGQTKFTEKGRNTYKTRQRHSYRQRNQCKMQ